MNCLPEASSKRLGIALTVVFLIALVMGAGPGLYLVNPNPGDPETTVAWCDVPVIYAWTVFWFLVEGGVVLVAYFCLWGRTPPSRPRESSGPVEDRSEVGS